MVKKFVTLRDDVNEALSEKNNKNNNKCNNKRREAKSYF